MKISRLCLLLFPIFFIGPKANAFPQLSRHGYFNCTACHVSPSGGGHLTPYGRQLSAELISTWSKAGEEQQFYGLIPESEYFSVAGYLRGLQMFTDSPASKEAKAILMQADLEVLGRYKEFTVVAAGGRRKIREFAGVERHQLYSRTHYLMWSSESGVNIRTGKFMPYWGLNFPNHFTLVRRDLAFGNDTERYTAEASYLGDGYSVVASHIFGNAPDRHARSVEKAESISVNKGIGESHRVGAGYYHGSQPSAERDVVNLYGIAAWTKNLFSQFEFDYQWRRPSVGRAKKGLVTSHQLGYEVLQGLIPYLQTQYEMLDNRDPRTRILSNGLGLNWYPRPHLEAEFFGGQEKVGSRAENTILYGMLNIYL